MNYFNTYYFIDINDQANTDGHAMIWSRRKSHSKMESIFRAARFDGVLLVHPICFKRVHANSHFPVKCQLTHVCVITFLITGFAIDTPYLNTYYCLKEDLAIKTLNLSMLTLLPEFNATRLQ